MPIETANDIIKKAYEKIGFAGRDRIIDGENNQNALDLLNAQLDNYASQNSLIAYDSLLDFPVVGGQREYTFSKNASLSPDVDSYKIVTVKYLTIESGNVQYPVDMIDDYVWYRQRRNLTFRGRPFQAFLQNSPELSTIFFLRIPEKNYAGQIKGKFALQNLDFTTDIRTVPNYYKLFWIYELGRILADFEPAGEWSAQSERIYNRYLENLTSTNDMDLTAVTSSVLNNGRSRGRYYDYAGY